MNAYASSTGDQPIDDEKLKVMEKLVIDSSITQEIKDMNPEEWFNIPICVVRAITNIIE